MLSLWSRGSESRSGVSDSYKKIWEQLVEKEVLFGGNASELFFVENDLESFQEKLEKCSFEINYVHKLKTYEWGQKAIRIYDPDGHLIEIGELKN